MKVVFTLGMGEDKERRIGCYKEAMTISKRQRCKDDGNGINENGIVLNVLVNDFCIKYEVISN